MPTYEYKCDDCEYGTEIFHSIKDKVRLRKCPGCGKRKLRRQISAGAGVIFKGTGFYSTDYRDPGYKRDAEKDHGES